MGKIDIATHFRLEAEGYMQIGRHAEHDLLIHNYSQKAQFERFWTAETLMSRGLITDLEGRIVARPFGKFFNLDEYVGLYGPLPEENFEVYEKMDGSLGILYFADGKPMIATRGSFKSDQAIRANEMLHEKYAAVDFDPAVTYLFEIIYPENRIVVNYGEKVALVLLAMIDTKSGAELSLQTHAPAGIPVVEHHKAITDLKALQRIQAENREGFVLRFHGGLRVKVKFEEYVRLHRLVDGISTRAVWEAMRDGLDLEPLLVQIPDEYYDWVRKVRTELQAKFDALEAICKAEYREFPSRKEAAAHFLAQSTYPAVMFRMFDGRPYDHMLWQEIRPEQSRAFGNTGN